MRGLDPRIYPGIELSFRAMDCRVKPGNDAHAALAIHIQLSNSKLPARPHPRGAIAPELCVSLSPSGKQRAQGKPGAGWHPRSRVQMRKKKTHTSIQV
jgi:hypothetical protein